MDSVKSYVIKEFDTNKPVDETFFILNVSAYPDADVIDLR